MTTSKATATAGTAAASMREYAPRSWLADVFFGGVSVRTIQRWEEDETKHFPRPVRFGRTPLFNIAEVRQWVESCRAEAV